MTDENAPGRRHCPTRCPGPIHDILMRDWDPVGVRSVPEAQDEYDSYIPDVRRLLSAKPLSADAIVDYLLFVERDRMGLTVPDLAACRRAAEALVAWRLGAGAETSRSG